eukprot:363565-Chlamydomonas_euryale.AAC.11
MAHAEGTTGDSIDFIPCSASPVRIVRKRTVRTVRIHDVLRIRTYITPETLRTHVPCNPGQLQEDTVTIVVAVAGL